MSKKKQNTQKRFQPKLKVKRDDMVFVIAGADKSREKKRRVIEVYPDKNRVLVEGVNIISKHSKPSAQNPDGGIVKKEAPIHISNVALVDPKSGTATRVGRKKDEKGTTVRIAKKSGEVI